MKTKIVIEYENQSDLLQVLSEIRTEIQKGYIKSSGVLPAVRIAGVTPAPRHPPPMHPSPVLTGSLSQDAYMGSQEKDPDSARDTFYEYELEKD